MLLGQAFHLVSSQLKAALARTAPDFHRSREAMASFANVKLISPSNRERPF
jgi:hypothetical protein